MRKGTYFVNKCDLGNAQATKGNGYGASECAHSQAQGMRALELFLPPSLQTVRHAAAHLPHPLHCVHSPPHHHATTPLHHTRSCAMPGMHCCAHSQPTVCISLQCDKSHRRGVCAREQSVQSRGRRTGIVVCLQKASPPPPSVPTPRPSHTRDPSPAPLATVPCIALLSWCSRGHINNAIHVPTSFCVPYHVPHFPLSAAGLFRSRPLFKPRRVREY